MKFFRRETRDRNLDRRSEAEIGLVIRSSVPELTTFLTNSAVGFQVVAMIVMMFIGWIMNLLSKKNQPAPARRARQREPAGPREDPLQSEIDDFLAEVGGGRRPSPAEPVLIEVVPEESRRRPQNRPRPKQSRPVEQPAQMLSERHLESYVGSTTELGGGCANTSRNTWPTIRSINKLNRI